MGLGYKIEAMSTLNICLNTMDKNQDLVFITFADVIFFSWGAVVKFIKEMETKTNLHCTKADSLDFFSRKKVMTDLCLLSFRLHVGKSLNIHVLLLCFLVNFHICVDLPDKGTCSHVSNSTCNKHISLSWLDTSAKNIKTEVNLNVANII